MHTSDFSEMLERGLGRAVLYAHAHDMTPFRDVILNACLHCQSYDAQCEGTRSDFMFEIIQSTPDIAFYQEGILAGLAALTDQDTHDAPQRYELAALFAAQGDLEARQALYDKFTAKPALDDYAGAYEIVRVEGVTGMKFVAALIGSALSINEGDYYVAISVFMEIEEQIGEEAANHTLAEMLAEPTTRAFAELITANRYTDTNEPRPPPGSIPPYAEIKAVIEQGRYAGRVVHQWAQSASPEELITAAHDFLSASDPERIKEYSHIFWKIPFPLDPTLLFPFTRYDEHNTWWWTINVLEKVRHPAVRQFALDKIAQKDRAWRMADLLVNNYQDGDWAIWETLTEDIYEDKNEVHTLGCGVRDMFKAHPSDDAEGALLNMYERGPCSQCRAAFIRDLHTLGKLPAWMREECLHDSSGYTREFIETLKA